MIEAGDPDRIVGQLTGPIATGDQNRRCTIGLGRDIVGPQRRHVVGGREQVISRDLAGNLCMRVRAGRGAATSDDTGDVGLGRLTRIDQRASLDPGHCVGVEAKRRDDIGIGLEMEHLTGVAR